jgi:tellurite resistance protein
MNTAQQESMLTIVLMAAFADGGRNDAERDRVQRLASTLGAEAASIDVAGIARRVMLKEVSLATPIAALNDGALREQAYEMALTVCDADGARNEAETRFLASLRDALGIDAATADTLSRQADQIAEAPVAAASSIEPAPLAANMTTADMDKMILNYSLLNGALELLPQKLATMAIIPLQMRMVYRIGKAHGFELDSATSRIFSPRSVWA